MSRWLKYLIPLAILVLLIIGFDYTYNQHQALAEARGALWHSQVIAKADSARADSAEARADSAEAQARRHAQSADIVYIASPDSCKPYIAQATHEVVQAYEHEKQAATELRNASGLREHSVTDLQSTSKALAAKSKTSFFQHLIPKVGVGAAAGIDPFTHKPSTAVGVTLSWSVL